MSNITQGEPCVYKIQISQQMIKNQQYSILLEKLFLPEDSTSRININILRQICSSEDYHCLIDFTSILTRLFSAGKQRLSLRQLVGKTVNSQDQESGQKIQVFADSLSIIQLEHLIKQLFQIRKKLKYTVYSERLNNINQILKKSLEEIKLIDKKNTENGLTILGDCQILEEEYKKMQSSNIFQIQSGQSNAKISDLLKNTCSFLDGKFGNRATLFRFIGNEIIPILERNILSIPLHNHNQRESELSRTLKFLSQYYIPQYQIQVQISKNTLFQTRIFNLKLYRQFFTRNYFQMLKSISKIINQAILCPSSISIQLLLLKILRRFYLLEESGSNHSTEYVQNFRTSQQGSPIKYVKNPLFLVIRNISLFSEGHEEEMKQAAMLTYKVVKDKNDLELSSLLQNSEEIRFLRNSKYYSSKAYTYADQIEKVYDPTQLGGLFLKNHQIIQAREVWTMNILVERPSSLICWELYIANYDIKFGIFKIQQLKDMTHEQFQQGIGCKQIYKMQKIQNYAKNPNRGHIFLKNGIYRIVFDNSFSMMRSKDLYYSFLHLQCNS